MRRARLFLPVLLALTAAACAREQQSTYYVVDPATGQAVPVVQQYTQPQYGQYANPQYAPMQYGQYAQAPYGQPAYAQPPRAQTPGSKRGLLNTERRQPTYAPQPYMQQYGGPQVYQQPYAPQTYQQPYAQQPYQQPYAQQSYGGGAYAAAPGYAYAPAQAAPAYTLDSGDRLRIVVFGQDGITGSYLVDAGGNVSLPLIGSVPARGYTTARLSSMIGDRLKQGYVREPHVTVAVESYRPFFILGEVTTPGQYPYVAHMTAENAIAIAGGFGPRARKDRIELTRNYGGQQIRTSVPLNYPLLPGDTVMVKERWF
jgi:polysaccharide export outer membrane protein